MKWRTTLDLFPLLFTAVVGLLYVLFFMNAEPVLLAIFGLQILRLLLGSMSRGGKSDSQ